MILKWIGSEVGSRAGLGALDESLLLCAVLDSVQTQVTIHSYFE